MRIKYLSIPFLFILGAMLISSHIFFLTVGKTYQIWWADIILHFSGGFFIGLVALWFLFNRLNLPVQKEVLPYYIILISIISFTALIGVLWEFYEYIMDLITGYKSYSIVVMQENMKDTMSDLFLDLLGAAVSSIFLKFKKKVN